MKNPFFCLIMKYLMCCSFCLVALAAKTQVPELSVPGHNLFADRIAAAQTVFPFWNGTNRVISIKEFRFDSNDVDLKGRTLPSENAAANLSTHANIMATLAAGAGNANLAGRGVAPGAWLVSSRFEGLMPDANYESLGVNVQCHAYGLPIMNQYGQGAGAYDQSVLEHPNLVHVFSAGNKGDSFATTGLYAQLQGFSNLSGELKMAKNALVVGATDSFHQVMPFSSKGPAYDGRIKPDLVAFGQNGSSESTALVSGAIACVQQALLEQQGEQPKSCLSRAVLLNTANDLGRPGPDFESGFGHLNLQRALQTVENGWFMTGEVSTTQPVDFSVAVPPNLAHLKCMLVWDDPPAVEGAAHALRHDLDLRLTDPNGGLHLPWVLNITPHPDSLQKPAGKGRDTLNNVEQVAVQNPASGLWTLSVRTSAGVTGAQPFALVWYRDTLRHFEWVYPMKSTPTEAGKSVLLRWESTLTDTFARLEWRSTDAPDWTLVTAEMPLRQSWWRFVLPGAFHGAQVRVVAAGMEIMSDTFVISPEIRINVGFNCPDSVMLFWNRVDHSPVPYQIFGLGSRYMEPLLVTMDTVIVLPRSTFQSARFAVAPILQGTDITGARSPAPDVGNQGVACYFVRFWAEIQESASVQLSLDIGTDYGVSSVVFEKWLGGTWSVIAEQQSAGIFYSRADDMPFNGLNRYRVRLRMANGAELWSDVVEVYFPGSSGWLVFPNPARSGTTMNVLTETGEGMFALFDLGGRKVMEVSLSEKKETIPLEGIQKGIYFFRLTDENGALGSGKIVIN